MLLALLMVAQVATGPVATCRATDDPQQRTWILERHDAAWRIVFRSRALDKPQVVLLIPNAAPVIGEHEIRVSHKSANGGRTIEWRMINGPSTLDLYVNHGLEVNVEADLDPAVDLMNTDGPIDVTCRFDGGSADARRAFDGRSAEVQQAFDGRSEFTSAIGVARSVKLISINRRPRLRRADDQLGPRADARVGAGGAPRAICVGR